MTLTPSHAAATYQTVEVTSRSPLELVVMLYDGALRFCDQAATAMDAGDMPTKAVAMSRAFAILAELQNTLNLQEGGDVAQSLDRLYNYVTGRLLDANVKKDPAPIEEAIRLLRPLRDAWAQIATPVPAAPAGR